MVLYSDLENLGVSEFELQIGSEAEKLFRQISFYNNNAQFLKSKLRDAEAKPVNITSLYAIHSEVLGIMDYTNTIIDKNLEETDVIVGYLGQQKGATNDFAQKLLVSMQNWMEDTLKQYELMEKDAKNIVSEYEILDIDAEFETTKHILDNLKSKTAESSEHFKAFRKASATVRENLGYLKEGKNHAAAFSDQMEKYIAAVSNADGGSSLHLVIMLLLAGAGLFVMLALCAILWRLNASQKRPSLGAVM